jgi:cytoskeletal protein RodZ
MIEFGKTLREAREAKGYSISQLAEATHLMHQIVQDLENENFSKIAAPIYGRGFVKLYCEAVGLDPVPLVAEYMAIQNGEREATIRVRSVAPPPPPPPPPAPEPAPAPVNEPKPMALPLDEPVAAAPKRPLAPLRPPAPLPEQQPIKSAVPPVRIWRVAVVALVAAGVLWALIAGATALYRATMTAPDAETEKTVEPTEVAKPAEPAAPEPATETATPAERTPIAIPPLYID